MRRFLSIPRLAGVLVVVVMICACPHATWASDTDTVVLANGDRLRGEVKGLKFGQLTFKTDSMSTVYIKWDRVASVESASYFEVEQTDGARHYGSLGAGRPATLAVWLDGNVVELPLASVVSIQPIKSSFWDRLDGSISLGASYAKSSGIGQGSLSADVRARRRTFEFETRFDTTLTVQSDEERNSRTVLTTLYNRMLTHRWYVPFTGKFEQNSELGLSLRSSLGAGFGRYLVQTNRSLLGASAGLMVNREVPVDGERSDNAELILAANYSYFTYDTPKTNLTLRGLVLPSLSVSGRVRSELDVSLSREIVKDFTVGLTTYYSYDSKPADAAARRHDFGVSLTVGWMF